MAAVDADPEVMRWIRDGSVRDEQQTRDGIRAGESEWETRGFGLFAVEIRSTGEPAGFTGPSVPHFLPEVLPAVGVGWRLGRSHWGRGSATEAAAAAVRFGFEERGPERIVSIAQVGNDASERVMTGLGMRPVRETVSPACGRRARVLELSSDQYAAATRWRRQRGRGPARPAGGPVARRRRPRLRGERARCPPGLTGRRVPDGGGAEGGRIVTVGSRTAPRAPGPGAMLYAMGKAAPVGPTEAPARELGPRGITADIVHPGPTDTGMNPADGPYADGQAAMTALGRFGTAGEVASMVAYLTGAAYVTGAEFAVDGGHVA